MKVYQVGGSVRDEIMGIKPHDIDYCVVGSSIDEMLSLGYKQVGKDFPVFLHPETKEEYALARTERKTGDKHTDFEFVFDKSVSLVNDLVRRDFTCNAIAKDIDTKEYIDPFGGIKDIENKVLRMVRAETFVEDPLRVLRLCRFTAQLGFRIDALTLYTCQQMVNDGVIDYLTPERVWKEFEKALNTDHFDYFIKALKWTGALKVILPEVSKLFDVPENIEHHPEGNTGEHTLLVLDKASKASPKMKFALLLHDVGKGLTPESILPKHNGHEERGLAIIESICDRLRVPNDYRDYALMICRTHMKAKRIADSKPGTVYDFIDDICGFKDKQLLLDVFEASTFDLLGRGKEPSEKNDKYLKDGLAMCIKMFDILSDIKADKFPELQRFRGKEFGEMLRVKKIQYFLDNLK